MGTWFNTRLIVSGPKLAMQRFARHASRAAALAGDEKEWIKRSVTAIAAQLGDEKAARAFEKTQKLNPHFFTYSFKFGEGGDLSSTPMRRVGRHFEKKYVFQMKGTDGRDYFPDVSRDWPDLQFVLVTACEDEFLASLIQRGRLRQYTLPSRRFEAILKKRGYDPEDGSDEYLYWESTWEAMDLAEAKWRPFLGARHKRTKRQMRKGVDDGRRQGR
jgi:hypothetical protein